MSRRSQSAMGGISERPTENDGWKSATADKIA
jgi:hypothetical protein